MEDIDEANRIGFYLQHLEIGPLKLPEPSHWNIFKEGIWNISSLVIPSDGGQDSHHGKITLDFCGTFPYVCLVDLYLHIL